VLVRGNSPEVVKGEIYNEAGRRTGGGGGSGRAGRRGGAAGKNGVKEEEAAL
jgi:hypothetical protein